MRKGTFKGWEYHWWCPCEICQENRQFFKDPPIEQKIKDIKKLRKNAPIFKLIKLLKKY